jgi:Xaa-Pro aminopeptidase
MARARARLLYAASETDPDILYPTGFFAPDPFLFVQAGGKRVLVMSDLELDRARRQATVDQVLSWTAFARKLEARGVRPGAAPVIAAALRHLKVRAVAS